MEPADREDIGHIFPILRRIGLGQPADHGGRGDVFDAVELVGVLREFFPQDLDALFGDGNDAVHLCKGVIVIGFGVAGGAVVVVDPHQLTVRVNKVTDKVQILSACIGRCHVIMLGQLPDALAVEMAPAEGAAGLDGLSGKPRTAGARHLDETPEAALAQGCIEAVEDLRSVHHIDPFGDLLQEVAGFLEQQQVHFVFITGQLLEQVYKAPLGAAVFHGIDYKKDLFHIFHLFHAVRHLKQVPKNPESV